MPSPTKSRRDVLLALQGDPDDEEHDLVVRMPGGIIATLVTLLFKATGELDKSADSSSAEVQMLKISNGAAADPIGDQCVLQLTLENFALPTLLSRKVAVKLIVELEKAVAGLGRFSAFQRGSLGSAVACMAIGRGWCNIHC